jgi:DNA-binding SARP family transcriptional activator/TolB-like protein
MLSLRLLGGASLRIEHGEPDGEALQTRRMALLALLATSRMGAVSREKLTAYLWPEAPAERGRHLLSESVYVLRRALGASALRSEGDSVRLDSDLVSCDVVEFESAVERGDLESAASLYSGPFLDGFFVKNAPEFDRWVESERQRLADSYAAVLERLAEREQEAGDHPAAVRWWSRLTTHDPYNSRYALRLMEALAVGGDPANAIQQAEQHARLLERDLDIEPPADLLDFAEQLSHKLERAGLAVGPPDASDDASPARAALPRVPLVAGEPRSPPRRLTRRIAGFAFGGALALSAVVTGWLLLGRAVPEFGAAGIAVSPNRVAVLPFEFSGDEESAYLGAGMAELLSTAIDGAGELTAVDPFALLKYVEREYADPDPQQGAEIARRFGAGLFILGSVLEAGGSYRASATLYDLRRGRMADAEVVVGDEASVLYELTPELARRLLIERYAGAANRLARVGVATTQSFDALKAYLQGEAFARAGIYDSAYVAYRRAVELDTTFALAYYQSAANVFWLPGMWNEEALEQARRFSAGLSERDSLLIDALHAWRVRDNWEEAEHLYGRILSRYPDELNAWGRLAYLLFYDGHKRGRPVAELRRVAEKTLALDLFDEGGNDLLGFVAAFEGDFETVGAARQRMLDTNPQGSWSPQYQAMLASLRGDESALDTAVEALRAGPHFLVWATGGWLAHQAEDPDAARRLFEILTELDRPSDWRTTGYSHLIWLELARGRWNAAQRQIAALSTLRPNRPPWAAWAAWLHPAAPVTTGELIQLRDSIVRWHPDSFADTVLRPFYLGRVHSRLGEPELAEAVAAEVEVWAAGRDLDTRLMTVAGNLALTLRAQAARARGQPEEALSYLLQIEARRAWFDSEAMHAFERWLRAEVLYDLGRYDEARHWYAGFGMKGMYDQTFMAPARLRLGDIYELLGDPETAISHYKRFLQRWKDCDPELHPQLEAAQRALERLAAEPTGG